MAVLTQLSGIYYLLACLLYGAGLRLMECVRLGVKDVDFTYHQLTVRDGKGRQDRVPQLSGNRLSRGLRPGTPMSPQPHPS